MSLEGYRGRLLELLRSAGASVGDELVVSTASGDVEGTLMPRYQLSDQLHLVLKLKNGYNVGMALGRISGVRVKGKGREPSFSPPPRPRATAGLPKVLILGTGGTIASRVDYRTGGVKAALSSEELYHLVPELSGIADISTEATMNIYSENMTAEHWSALARRAGDALKEGFDGIVVTHGTDTMHYTSAALSFALDSPPVPVVLVGSQRSSDRPSSDSATNLIGAVTFAARAPVSGVFVVMHA
ncbi:MAG: asparaginase, partial [Nitrososphaerota archaeon]|nr:asparaginase [Nitrososphaerota archaeon]